jgi:hypothetical protein
MEEKMNERIRELALQAGAVNVWEWASDDVLDTKNMDAKKFAELIIKETLQVAKVGMEFGPSMEEAVYTYFGIEE